jgi:hypothetical protein
MAGLEHEAVTRVIEARGEEEGWHYFVMVDLLRISPVARPSPELVYARKRTATLYFASPSRVRRGTGASRVKTPSSATTCKCTKLPRPRVHARARRVLIDSPDLQV